jgi:hypothetical protein
MVFKRKRRQSNIQVLTACLERLITNDKEATNKVVIDKETHKPSIEPVPIKVDSVNEKKKKIPYINTILLMNKLKSK